MSIFEFKKNTFQENNNNRNENSINNTILRSSKKSKKKLKSILRNTDENIDDNSSSRNKKIYIENQEITSFSPNKYTKSNKKQRFIIQIFKD